MNALLRVVGASAFCLSAVGWTNATYAQAPEKKAYCIIEIKVTDPEAFKGYTSRVQATMDPFGGRYLARRGKLALIEGDPPAGAVVISGWPSLEKAQAWHDSAAYQEIIDIRKRSSVSRSYCTEALE